MSPFPIVFIPVQHICAQKNCLKKVNRVDEDFKNTYFVYIYSSDNKY